MDFFVSKKEAKGVKYSIDCISLARLLLCPKRSSPMASLDSKTIERGGWLYFRQVLKYDYIAKIKEFTVCQMSRADPKCVYEPVGMNDFVSV